MNLRLMTALTAMLLATQAIAQVPEGIDWVKRPSAQDFLAVYPKDAYRHELNGRVVIACVADERGMLTECAVAAENPVGQGFGEAALKLAPRFQLTATTRAGTSIKGPKINVPIIFKLS